MEEKIFLYRSNIIHYKIIGRGEPLILLHGYLTDSRIWWKMIPLLKDKFQLIVPDLPGHGKSKTSGPVNSMDFLGEVVYILCLTLGFKTVKIAGHSMGGYVALAFAEKHAEMLESLYLINSHPAADNMAKVLSRSREAEIIESGKKHFLFASFAVKNFYSENRKCLNEVIKEMIRISLEQPDLGILADLAGMMARPDRGKVINHTRFPVCIITGEYDETTPPEAYDTIQGKNLVIYRINNCGHLCILEKPSETARIIEQVSGYE
jgi:pimeloyl-ACP methyl ester carboxylesterase